MVENICNTMGDKVFVPNYKLTTCQSKSKRQRKSKRLPKREYPKADKLKPQFNATILHKND